MSVNLTLINYISAARSTEAHNALDGIISGLVLPFPVTPSDECAAGMQCPIEVGETRVYSVSLTCPSFAPTVSLLY